MTLDDIINAKITSALFSARITSANPTHTNYVFDTAGFGVTRQDPSSESLEDLVRQLVEEYSQPAEASTPEEKGFGLMDALRAGRSGVGGPPNISVLTRLVPYLVPIMIATGAAAILFDWAKGPGGPIDTRYERDLRNETLNFLSRQLQRDTEIGNRQLIIQSDANFKNLGGAGNSNTLRQIRERGDRLADVGLLVDDRAKGLERLS